MTTSELIEALLASGISQAELSRRSGIPQPRMSRWQAGVVPVGADDALRLHALHAELVAEKTRERAS